MTARGPSATRRSIRGRCCAGRWSWTPPPSFWPTTTPATIRRDRPRTRPRRGRSSRREVAVPPVGERRRTEGRKPRSRHLGSVGAARVSDVSPQTGLRWRARSVRKGGWAYRGPERWRYAPCMNAARIGPPRRPLRPRRALTTCASAMQLLTSPPRIWGVIKIAAVVAATSRWDVVSLCGERGPNPRRPFDLSARRVAAWPAWEDRHRRSF